MTATPFDQALTAARRLAPRERARLIAQLAEELVEPALAIEEAAPSSEDAWERLSRFRDDLYALGPVSPTLAEQLDADRRERDAMLMGGGVPGDDVHR